MSKLTVLSVKGDGRERGRSHGEALRDLIHDHMARWRDSLAADLKEDPDAYLDQFLEETDFLPAVKRWAPDLLAEVEGIAEGANAPFNLIFARQLSDEEPWHRREHKFSRLTHPGHAGCTSIGAWKTVNGASIVAQNMDLPHWCDGLQTLLRVSDTETGIHSFHFTIAGKINLAGMNSRGLAMACNTLSQLDYSRTGLPEDFVVRRFLSHSNLSDGVNFLESIEHASGQNYTVGEPGADVLNLECSAHSVSRFLPESPPHTVFHTNHALANTDQTLYEKRCATLDSDERRRWYHGTSHRRFESLEYQLQQLSAPPEIPEIKAILSSHEGGICRHADNETRNDNFTLGCLIMELGDAPRFHVAPGPPCETPFQTFDF